MFIKVPYGISYTVMYVSWFFFVVSLSLASSSIMACKKAQNKPEWENLMLAQLWPPTFCMSQKDLHSRACNPANLTKWIIHGLWPIKDIPGHVTDCLPQQTFDSAKIKDIEKDLNRTWPCLVTSLPYTWIWQHEWCEHGSCAQVSPELQGEAKYFRKTIDLHNNFSIDMALKSASIIPGNDYYLSNITNAIYDTFKVYPDVMCTSVQGKRFLSEIRICFEKDFTLRKRCYSSNQMTFENDFNCSTKYPINYPK
ncbi:ribonuclease T2-like isoform X2 [Anneissia japonica]|uniref:ribonuclease T2-like isoform X2 n=1 Tax=Anneissia japonica TaxID=1529436 RepID=UPI0014255DD1|nr:ribonuclease T2-like isoform X2 [Anneissia japonica]